MKTDRFRRLAAIAVCTTALVVAGAASAQAAPSARALPSFTDVAATAGIGFRPTFGDDDMSSILEATGFGCAMLDYNGDGLVDIYYANGRYMPGLSGNCDVDCDARTATNKLYRNDGDGTFTDVTVEAGVADTSFSMGVLAADTDNDGDTDLYITNYGRNTYYRNDGDGTFSEVTSEAKLTNDGRAMGIVAADYNGDGAIDLFVANDAMANYLYTSNGDGTFSDVALESGTAYSQSGNATSSMCGAVGDYDNDGDFDVLVPDMGYNSLYDNGGRLFQDVSFQTNLAAISGQYVSWGGGLIDYDLDGWLDIVLANGDAHRLAGQEDVLLRNVPGDDGRRRFADVWESAGRYFKTKHVGRGMAVGDIDNDGDLDVTIVNLDGAVALLRNDRSPDDGRHWLTVSLRGTRSNREGVGAVVSVRCGEDTFVRQRTVGGTYISSNDRRLHFGLGKSARVDELVVRWPSGLVQSVGPMEADRIIEIVEPTSE